MIEFNEDNMTITIPVVELKRMLIDNVNVSWKTLQALTGDLQTKDQFVLNEFQKGLGREEESSRCVHTEHCCVSHGCKYGNADCPVSNGTKRQSFLCEYCQDDPYDAYDRPFVTIVDSDEDEFYHNSMGEIDDDHERNCCTFHGCKYSDPTCIVAAAKVIRTGGPCLECKERDEEK